MTGQNNCSVLKGGKNQMIVQLRLDERLIHGQVVTAWARALDINTILVANDEAARCV